MQVYSEKDKIKEYPLTSSNAKIKRLIKFYLMPGWRNPEFSAREYQIEKIKSKRRLFRRLITPLTLIGFFLVLIVAFIAVYTPWLTELTLANVTPPLYPAESAFQPPSPEHPLGTTQFGWDILGRLIWGARTTLQAAVFPVAISIGGGVILGTISAYFGGWVDSIMMRICDIFLSLPMLIIVIVISPLIGKDLYSVLLIYGFLFIPYNIRFMRSLVLQVKQNDYVRAAISSGAFKFRVMFKHIFPNTISPIIISFFGAMGVTVIALAGLAFIGLGDPDVANWGADMMYARGHFETPGASLWPGFFIGITAIGFILIGDGLRDALDPRLHI
ncbi:MAG: ABC transporter permease [Candidatus Lokiarchaeota archaeon]|nr:ABC transporter permease [Candidatus Lokiarchaeota archaeon]